jgi:ribonuclease HI
VPSPPTDLPFYAQSPVGVTQGDTAAPSVVRDGQLSDATPDNDLITPSVEIHLTTEVKTVVGGGVKYGKWTAELRFGASRTEFSATDAHQTIHTRGAVLAAVAALGALKRRSAVRLHTDSEYLISGATAWLPVGMALGWVAGPKASRIRNHVLWGQLRDLAKRHSIDWVGPRKQADAEFANVMPHTKTELWTRTVGERPDTGYLYAGHESPWSESMDTYRAFTDEEMRNPAICSSVDSDDGAVAPLTSKEKEARKRIIARIAKHYRPEFIRPAPREQTPTPPITPIILEPNKVARLVAAFEELQPGTVSPSPPSEGQLGTVNFLRYPRATLSHRFPTAKTARLELKIGLEQ